MFTFTLFTVIVRFHVLGIVEGPKTKPYRGPGGGGALTFEKGRGVRPQNLKSIPLRTEVAYEPRGLRTKGPSPNGGLGNWDLT